jgi:hypothetical protein
MFKGLEAVLSTIIFALQQGAQVGHCEPSQSQVSSCSSRYVLPQGSQQPLCFVSLKETTDTPQTCAAIEKKRSKQEHVDD